MRVLGIDPGTRLTGYACIEPSARATRSRTSRQPVLGHNGDGCERGRDADVIEGGVIRLNGKIALADRLIELEADLIGVIERLKPDMLAIEKLYAHYAHPTTAIIMGHARGVALLAAARAGLAIVELGATEVKKSLTGNGHASKQQMQRAVQTQLHLIETPKPPDVADAIAIGLCAMRRGKAPGSPALRAGRGPT